MLEVRCVVHTYVRVAVSRIPGKPQSHWEDDVIEKSSVGGKPTGYR